MHSQTHKTVLSVTGSSALGGRLGSQSHLHVVLHVCPVHQGLYCECNGCSAPLVGEHLLQFFHAGNGLAVKLGDNILFL